MGIFYLMGWVLLGIVVTACLITFWDEIRVWLNNVAADAVEKVLGYAARERMHRSIVKIDRVMNKIRNRSVVYTKKTKLDSLYDKTTLLSEVSIHEISDEIINEISKSDELIEEFEYRN